MQAPQGIKLKEYPWQMGKILKIINGKVIEVKASSGVVVPVVDQSHLLGTLKIEQQVLFAETTLGAFIMAKGREQSDPLVLNCGDAKLILESNGTVALHNTHSHILLQPDGGLRITAKYITQVAEQQMMLCAHQAIHLNSPDDSLTELNSCQSNEYTQST